MKESTLNRASSLEDVLVTGDRPGDRDRPMLIEPTARRVRAFFGGAPVADSTDVKLLLERSHTPVYYFPKKDVRMELLEPSPTRTRCPYKGQAEYWHVRAGGELFDDLAWSYREPIPECPKIENLICFFNEKVDIEVGGAKIDRPQTMWSRCGSALRMARQPADNPRKSYENARTDRTRSRAGRQTGPEGTLSRLRAGAGALVAAPSIRGKGTSG